MYFDLKEKNAAISSCSDNVFIIESDTELFNSEFVMRRVVVVLVIRWSSEKDATDSSRTLVLIRDTCKENLIR